MHLKAAIEAGKNVFMEKPVAVDPVGVRSVIKSSKRAKQKKLAIVAGTQKRYHDPYREVMKRIHNGDIGQVVAGFCYWNMGNLWVKKQLPNWSDMEWQCRNWLYFCWLSGDHIVEQHIHNLDVMNWAIGSHPVKCMGMGGREVRKGPEYGNIFDHFAVEYEYPNGVRVMSMCRQTKGCIDQVSEHVIGTKGHTYTDHPGNCYIEGDNSYKYEGEPIDPYVQEHTHLIESIRSGQPLNEGIQVAESTMTAIMGRMSAYTGRALKWDWAMNASKLDLSPEKYEFCDIKVRPVPVPGVTKLV
jgi:predicted dehydrogenase